MKVAVLVSGGVDSSFVLYLLKKQNYAVTAFYIKVWLQDEFTSLGNCPWQEDLDLVKKVCSELRVPLEIISLQKEYWSTVVEESIQEIKSGLTPNPDFMCNNKIKFGKMLEVVSSYEDHFDYIASGHYAGVERQKDNIYLKESKDKVKDQTYFLAGLKKEQLRKIIFPLCSNLGNFSKTEVRELALKFNLANARRKDSQGICFLGKIKFREFIEYHLGKKTGKIISLSSGEILGEHPGFWYYTIGQRRGLNLGNGPWYVVKKNIHSNQIYVEREKEGNSKTTKVNKPSREHLIIDQINFLKEIDLDKKLAVKVRHGKKKHWCEIKAPNPTNRKDNKAIEIILPKEKQGTALGQYAVLYQDDYCILSGKIRQVFYSP